MQGIGVGGITGLQTLFATALNAENIRLKNCDSKEIQKYKLYIPMLRRVSLMISLNFDFLPVLVITTEYKYFRFCSMQIYLNFASNFSYNRSCGMGLSTRASRLLHKCHENDTICMLAAKLVLLWLRFGINDSVISCAVWRY